MILIPSVRRSARGRDKESMANRKFHKKQRFTPDPSYVPPYDAAILQLGLDHLKISDAVREKLLGAGVTTVMDVVVREDKDFYRISGFDKKNLGELKSALNNRRLRLKPPKPADEKPKAESEKNGSGERADKPAAKNDRAEKKEGDRRRDKFVKPERTGERENAPERRDRFGADKGKEVSDDRSKNRDRKDNRSDKKNKNQGRTRKTSSPPSQSRTSLRYIYKNQQKQQMGLCHARRQRGDNSRIRRRVHLQRGSVLRGKGRNLRVYRPERKPRRSDSVRMRIFFFGRVRLRL